MNYILSSVILLVVTIIIIYLFSIDNNIDKFKTKLNDTFTIIKSNQINYLNELDASLLLHFLKSQYTHYDNIMIPKRVFYTLDKTNNNYILNNVQIIGFKLHNNIFIENNHIITIKFIPIKNELFVGRYTLFGKNGNYCIENNIPNNVIPSIPEKKISSKKTKHISTNFKQNVTDNHSDVKDITTDVKDITTDVKDITTDVKDITSDIKDITSDIKDITSDIKDIATDVKNITATDVLDMIPDIIHLSSDEEQNYIITPMTRQKNHYA